VSEAKPAPAPEALPVEPTPLAETVVQVEAEPVAQDVAVSDFEPVADVAPAEATAEEELAGESLPVEWPVADTPVHSETDHGSEIPTSTPVLANAVDTPPVADAEMTKGKTIMTDVLETAKSYAEEAKTRFQSAFVEANDKAKAALEKSSKAFEEIGELTKGNLEAVVESSKIAAKGVEALGQEAAEFSRKSFEKTSSTMKSFAAVKTPAEFFQLQSDLLSATLDSFASEASKNSEAFLKLASDISTPISNRVSIVTEKMKVLAA